MTQLKIIKHILKESGFIPNNPKLPVLIYKNVIDFSTRNHSDAIQNKYGENHWYRSWVNGIYDFNHYHSNNHEVLGVAKGQCTVCLGGDDGIEVNIEKGDLLVLPAGTSHRNLSCSSNFTCVGAYSINREYNMKYGRNEDEKESSLEMILSLPLPHTDPLFGSDGPLIKYWK
jgi:uncharacterized protein YjlB